jgi:hypothetical protein
VTKKATVFFVGNFFQIVHYQVFLSNIKLAKTIHRTNPVAFFKDDENFIGLTTGVNVINLYNFVT